MSYMSFVAGGELSGGIKYAVGKCPVGEMSDTQFHRLTTPIIHHPSLFHSRLKTFLFCKSFPP